MLFRSLFDLVFYLFYLFMFFVFLEEGDIKVEQNDIFNYVFNRSEL